MILKGPGFQLFKVAIINDQMINEKWKVAYESEIRLSMKSD